jgi:thioredoxin-dependent peroxiredoxin
MAPELRKRKAPEPSTAPPTKKTSTKKANPIKEVVDKVKAAVTGKPEPKDGSNGTATAPAKAKQVKVGDAVTLAGFGGEIETHEGTKTSLEKLVEESKSGVVLFTYPKASTPGCM